MDILMSQVRVLSLLFQNSRVAQLVEPRHVSLKNLLRAILLYTAVGSRLMLEESKLKPFLFMFIRYAAPIRGRLKYSDRLI